MHVAAIGIAFLIASMTPVREILFLFDVAISWLLPLHYQKVATPLNYLGTATVSLCVGYSIVLKTHVANTVKQSDYLGKYRIVFGVTVLVLAHFFFTSRMMASSRDLLIRNCIELPAYLLVMSGIWNVLFKQRK
jgi:hypothetical protein